MTNEREQLRSDIAALKRQIEALRRPSSYDERDAMANAQVRADAVAQLFGERANPHLAGESSLRYRARFLNRFKQYSPRFGDGHFDHYSNAAMSVAEEVVFADAATAARGDLDNGRLVAVQGRMRRDA